MKTRRIIRLVLPIVMGTWILFLLSGISLRSEVNSVTFLDPLPGYELAKGQVNYGRFLYEELDRRIPSAKKLTHISSKTRDSIVLALALANNDLYSLADSQTQEIILTDMEKHFAFFRDLEKDRQEKGIGWSWEETPISAFVFWTDRLGSNRQQLVSTMQALGVEKMNRTLYWEFVDRIETLEAVRKDLLENHLVSPSPQETAENIENYVHQKRAYRSSMENLIDFHRRKMLSEEDLMLARKEHKEGKYYFEYLGKKRRWDEFPWLNYQVNEHFRKDNRFRGDCGSTTVVQMGYYRAAGLPVASFQWIHPKKVAAYTHNFPVFYHPRRKQWVSVQKPIFYEAGGRLVEKPEPIFLHFTKPIFHHAMQTAPFEMQNSSNRITYGFYPGELGDSQTVSRALTLGWDGQRMDEIFFSLQTQKRGLLLHRAQDKPVDRDGDGLLDEWETRLGTNPNHPDTDGDGLSDLYEFENGLDPLEPNPLDSNTVVLDGLTGEFGKDDCVTDPQGDIRGSKDRLDISHFCARRVGKNLHLAARFHNDTKENKVQVFSVMIEISQKGSGRKRFWVQWNGHHSQMYSVIQDLGHDRYTPIPAPGLKQAQLGDVEFLVPGQNWTADDNLDLVFHSSGFFGGKHQVVDDFTRSFRLPGNPYADSQKSESVAWLTGVDPKGDTQNKKIPWDIESIRCLPGRPEAGTSLERTGALGYCRVSFHKPIPSHSYGIHTLALEHPEGKELFWLQWWGTWSYGVWHSTDGSKLTEWTGGTEGKLESYWEGDEIVLIHRFPFLNGYSIRYFVGDQVDGKYVHDLDEIEKLTIQAEP